MEGGIFLFPSFVSPFTFPPQKLGLQKDPRPVLNLALSSLILHTVLTRFERGVSHGREHTLTVSLYLLPDFRPSAL